MPASSEETEGAGAETGPRKILRVGLLQDVADWDPLVAHDLSTYLVLAQVYETPFVQNVLDHPPTPLLFSGMLDGKAATSLERSGKVRGDICFSDGTPADASAIAQALRRSDPLRGIAEVSAEDDRITFTLTRPEPGLERILTKRWCAVASETEDGFRGTGPFMVLPAKGRGVTRLTRNPHYRGRVRPDELRFVTYPDAPTMVRAFDDGELDFTMSLSRSQADKVETGEVRVYPGNNTALLFFNTEQPRLRDQEVREVLTAALDRRRIAMVSDPEGAGRIAKSPLPPMLGRHDDRFKPNRDWAQQQAERLGDRMPKRLSMLVVWGPRPYLPAPREAADEVASQLATLGVEVEVLQATGAREYMRTLQDGSYDMVLGGWIAESDDPVEFIEALVSAGSVPHVSGATAGTGNFSRWKDAGAMGRLDRCVQERSPETLAALLDYVAAEVPFIPFLHGPSVVVLSSRVREFVPTASYMPSFKDVVVTAD